MPSLGGGIDQVCKCKSGLADTTTRCPPNPQPRTEVLTIRHTMVYDWEAHRDTLNRLYVDEKRSVEDIIAYMRTNHNFAPRYVEAHVVFACTSGNSRHGDGSLPDCLGASCPLP